jgi:hypothetical protein
MRNYKGKDFMSTVRRSFVSLVLLAWPILQGATAASQQDAAAMMARVAENVEKTTEARRLYVYRQFVTSSLVRSDGQIARKEKREYQVFPTEKSSEKKLISLSGQCRQGKETISYTEDGFKSKGMDVDGDLIRDLTRNLVDQKGSRDGIPHSLFPLRLKDLPGYKFALNGEFDHQGRRTFKILFEPAEKHNCINIGDDDGECGSPSWKGEAWIDATEMQPVRLTTQQAFRIPWGVKVFLGTNLQQTGFSVTYNRLAENVWFPVSYGTEFRFNVLWGYKRTVTLSLRSDGFQKTDAASKIEYELAKEP